MPFTAKKKKIITREDIDAIIIKAFDTFPEFKSLRAASLFAFLWKSGCRISEALAVRRDDVRLDEKYLYVSLVHLKSRQAVGAPIVLPFRLYPEDKHKNLLNVLIIKQSNSIFPGEKLWDIGRKQAWHDLVEISGQLYPHLFRHSTATLLADEGIADSQLRVYMGWAKKSLMPTNYVERSKLRLTAISDVLGG